MTAQFGLSKLYLSGIEIRQTPPLQIQLETPNCTLVELKFKRWFVIEFIGLFSKLYLSGIEIVDLPPLSVPAIVSKLYLSGIEMCSSFGSFRRSIPPNCTLVELKSWNKLSIANSLNSPNCTLVELKWNWYCQGATKNCSSKLYLSGIEIEFALL